ERPMAHRAVFGEQSLAPLRSRLRRSRDGKRKEGDESYRTKTHRHAVNVTAEIGPCVHVITATANSCPFVQSHRTAPAGGAGTNCGRPHPRTRANVCPHRYRCSRETPCC